MKKILLGLGTLATIATPIAVTVSCGTKTHNKHEVSIPNEGNKNIEGTGTKNNNTIPFKEDAKANLEDAIQEPSSENFKLPKVQAAYNKVNVKARTIAELEIDSATTKVNADQIVSNFNTLIDNFPKLLAELIHDGAITNAKDMLSGLLGAINYNMEDDEQSRLVNYLVKVAGDNARLHVDGINPGLKAKTVFDSRHDSDDYMVLIKGAPAKKLEGDQWSVGGTGNHLLKRSNPSDPVESGTIGNELDPEDKALEGIWGETTKEVSSAKFVIFFQTNDKTGATTCQVSEVVEYNGHYYELDAEEAAYANEMYNKEFALKEFTATEGGVIFSAPGGDTEYPELDPYRSFELDDKDGKTIFYTFTDERKEKTTSVVTKVDGDKFWDASGDWVTPANKGLSYDFKTIMSTLELKIIDPLKVTKGTDDRGIDRLTDITLDQFRSFSFGVRKSLRDAALEYVTIMAKGTYPKQIETLIKNNLVALSEEDQKIFIGKFMTAFDRFSKA